MGAGLFKIVIWFIDANDIFHKIKLNDNLSEKSAFEIADDISAEYADALTAGLIKDYQIEVNEAKEGADIC